MHWFFWHEHNISFLIKSYFRLKVFIFPFLLFINDCVMQESQSCKIKQKKVSFCCVFLPFVDLHLAFLPVFREDLVWVIL